MKFSINHNLIYEFGLLLILNILIVSSLPVVSDIASVFYLFWLPGLILLALIEKTDEKPANDPWGDIIHIIALSLVFLFAGGLLANIAGPALGITNHPLGKNFLLLVFDELLFALLIVKAIFKKNNLEEEDTYKFKLLPYVGFALLPALSIAGTTVLNNGGSNILIIILIVMIAILISSSPIFARFSGLSL